MSRDQVLTVRVTADEKAVAQEWADRNGLSLSDYVRKQITEPVAPRMVVTGNGATVTWVAR